MRRAAIAPARATGPQHRPPCRDLPARVGPCHHFDSGVRTTPSPTLHAMFHLLVDQANSRAPVARPEWIAPRTRSAAACRRARCVACATGDAGPSTTSPSEQAIAPTGRCAREYASLRLAALLAMSLAWARGNRAKARPRHPPPDIPAAPAPRPASSRPGAGPARSGRHGAATARLLRHGSGKGDFFRRISLLSRAYAPTMCRRSPEPDRLLPMPWRCGKQYTLVYSGTTRPDTRGAVLRASLRPRASATSSSFSDSMKSPLPDRRSTTRSIKARTRAGCAARLP